MIKAALRQRSGNPFRRRTALLAAVAILVVACGVAALFIIPSGGSAQNKVGDGLGSASKSEILSLWSQGERATVLDRSREALRENPLDAFFLSFEGISAYYTSYDYPEGDERQAFLDEAVASLRKALASGEKLPVKAQVEYVLGKAYFQKGSPWFDLSAEYLSRSITDGYQSQDTEQYLGLAFAGLGMHEKAVERFEFAMAKAPSDILKLSAAISYNELGKGEKVAELLAGLASSASDAIVMQKARFMLADIAFSAGDFSKAQGLYDAIVQTDPDSAEAWYKLGLVYATLKEPIKARAAWRRATSIDPNHVEARKKLAERL